VAHRRLPTRPVGVTDGAGKLVADDAVSLDRTNPTPDKPTYLDSLTGLPNRDRLLDYLEGELAEWHPTALGVVTLQNLDEIIAAFGETGAVATARAIAARLEDLAAGSAIVARVGGPRFAISWTGEPDARNPADRAKQILAHLGQDIHDGEMAISLHMKMGIALAPGDARDARTLLDAAQTAVPVATKEEIAFYAPAAQHSARREMELKRELRRALARQEFTLHYQPVVALSTDSAGPRTIGAEALLRWTNPHLGAVSPAVFIPIAERIGLMDQIGPWTLTKACEELRAWDDAGLPPLRLAVNLSAQQFSDHRLVRTIADTIGRLSLPPDRLEVEMTETTAMQDHAVTHRVFGELRELGVTVAIDDFGTGYAAISHLRNLTFDTMKIDREFVRDVDSSASGRSICKALTELAHDLGIAVIAEGVEREEEVITLQRYGCRIFQGYHFGRPMPSAEFAKVLRNQKAVTAQK
jgi:predicted signal transduction protein with EAL and GGDEF domain